MYSGTTLTKYSGRILGAHQKIDRVSRRHLSQVFEGQITFPSIKQILHFEGVNGPDAIKRKSPAQNEPWHYIDPFDDGDTELLHLIDTHHQNLSKELSANNQERAAFEAAWLAHALVDGLTPAHHFPYEQKLTELRGGESIDGRTTIMKKLILPGGTIRERVSNNWKMWGGKGLMTTHGTFEWGVATMMAPLSLRQARPTHEDLKLSHQIGLRQYFMRTACEVAMLDLYQQYYEHGWTPRLANLVRTKLAPMIVRTVTVAWYLAASDAAALTQTKPGVQGAKS